MPTSIEKKKKKTKPTMATLDFYFPKATPKSHDSNQKKTSGYKHQTINKVSDKPLFKSDLKWVHDYEKADGSVTLGHYRNVTRKLTPEEKVAKESETFIAVDESEESVMMAKSMNIEFLQELARGKDLTK